jgi:hypothetical protein
MTLRRKTLLFVAVALEKQLTREVQLLRIGIDQAKKARHVREITETDYFQSLRVKAKELRARSARTAPPTPDTLGAPLSPTASPESQTAGNQPPHADVAPSPARQETR